MLANAVSGFAPAAGTPAAWFRPRRRCTATVGFWWAAGIMTAGAVVTALLFHGRRSEARVEAEAESAPEPRAVPEPEPVSEAG